MRVVLKVLGWCVLAAFAAVPADAAPLRVALEADAVVISGLTPAGQAVLLGVTREIGEDDFPTAKRHLAVLSDEDGDSTIRYPMEGGVPLRSLFAAADLATGGHASVAPETLGPRQVVWRGRGVERLQDGRDAVEDQRNLVELLVVRPKVGVWALRVNDGGETDGDGLIDGRLTGILERMEPLGASPEAPALFQPADVVMALDPATLEITVSEIPALQ